jgi:hypothetical protein
VPREDPLTFVIVGEITQGAGIINLSAYEARRLVVISISFWNHLEDGCMGIESCTAGVCKDPC